MNFDFSEDEKHLREEAERFLRDRCPRTRVRQVLETGADYDPDLWRNVAALGWTGLGIPEAYGGLGMSPLEACVLAEALGGALAPLPTVPSVYVVTDALVRMGSEAQKRKWLPRLASGETIGALAVSEGDGIPDLARLAAVVDGASLSGVKRSVPAGMIADLVIVVAVDRGEPGLFLADLSDATVVRTREISIDPTRSHATLSFTDVPAERLGAGDARAALESILVRAAVLTAFEQVAGAEAALQMARNYALERFAFGRPIGSFQAIKHKLADVVVATTLARSNAYFAASTLAADDEALPMAAACARVSASKAFDLASQENLHVHGGAGYTWEVDCHLYYRRARELSLVLGSSRAWKERIACGLEARHSRLGDV